VRPKGFAEFRIRRCEKIAICFLPRHARGKKHLSAIKRARTARALQMAAAFSNERLASHLKKN